MNAIYDHVVFYRDEQSLPSALLGWRYQILTQPLIMLLKQDIEYLTAQMKVFR